VDATRVDADDIIETILQGQDFSRSILDSSNEGTFRKLLDAFSIYSPDVKKILLKSHIMYKWILFAR